MERLAGWMAGLGGLVATHAWAIDSAGRISWASRQAGTAAPCSSGSPLRALAVGFLLGLAFAAACLWVRRSSPEREPEELPPE